MIHRVDVVASYYSPIKAKITAQAARLVNGRGHLERHWLRGPHVRLCLDDQEALEEILSRLEELISSHPSSVELDESDFLTKSEQLGQAELIPGPYGPLRPDNAVTLESRQITSLTALLGSAEAVECRAELLRDALDLIAVSADWLVSTGNNSANRSQLALTALASHAAAYPVEGINGGYQSFLSHLEDFLTHHDPDGRLRHRFATIWSRHRKSVTTFVRNINTNLLAGAWHSWSVRSLQTAGAAYDRGELPALPGPEYAVRAKKLGGDDLAQRWDPSARQDYSEFHTSQRRLDFARLPYEREFVTYRFCTNILYQLLLLLDVTVVERLQACSLLSNAVEEISGITWQERLDSYVQWQDARDRAAS